MIAIGKPGEIGKKLVFIHLAKTGGMTMMRALQRQGNSSRLQYHLPARDTLLNLPKFGFVRNPWAWYLSVYTWINLVTPRRLMPTVPSPIQVLASETFPVFLRKLLNPRASEKAYFRAVGETYRLMGLKGRGQYPVHATDEFYESGLGFYEWRYRASFFSEAGESLLAHIGKTETLETDFSSILALYGLEVPKLPKARHVTLGRLGLSYRDVYRQPQIDLVQAAERYIIEAHGYKF